jgi:hypothetical protein
MMMMMGLSRPKIRNDGSAPGPPSLIITRHTSSPLFSSSSLSLYFYSLSSLSLSLYFYISFYNAGGGDDYRRFTAPPASTPPSGDHGLLSRQLNASRLKEGPFFLPPLFVCFFLLHACHLVSALLVVLLYPFSFFVLAWFHLLPLRLRCTSWLTASSSP